MPTGHDSNLPAKRSARIRRFALAAAFLLTVCFALCIRTGAQELMTPAQTFHNLALWVRLKCADALELPLALQRQRLIAQSPYYFESIARFRNLIVTMLCGAAIAVGGAVFQLLFKNPMAAPTMLGVGSGISLGLMILVVQFSVNAYAMTTRRYVYCLGLAFFMLFLVMAAGKFAGKNRRSVTDMLLAGAVLGQISGAVITFLRFNMEQEDLIVYQSLSLYGFSVNADYDFAGTALMILLGIVVLCLLPLFAMRFSLDTLCYSDEEAKSLGVHPSLVRAVILIFTTVMVTAAILYCGTIGTLSLAVPHICRYLYGAKFKNLLCGSAFLGAFLLLICRAVSSLIYLDGMGFFPIGTLAGLVCAPILAVVLSQKRRGWE